MKADQKYFVAYRKRPNLRLEFVITAVDGVTARRIARSEVRRMRGWTFDGSN